MFEEEYSVVKTQLGLFIEGRPVDGAGIQAFLTGNDQSLPYVIMTLKAADAYDDHEILSRLGVDTEIWLNPADPISMDIIEMILSSPTLIEKMPQESADVFLDHILPLMKTVDKSSWKQMEHDLSDRAAGIEPQHQLSRPKKKVAEIINLEDRMRQSAREKLKTPRATRYGDPLDIDRPVCRKTLAQWPLQMRATLG